MHFPLWVGASPMTATNCEQQLKLTGIGYYLESLPFIYGSWTDVFSASYSLILSLWVVVAETGAISRTPLR